MAALVFVPKYGVYKLRTDSLICYYPVFYWGIFLDLAAIGGRICVRKQDLWLQSSQMDARICSKTDNVFLISHAISSSSPGKRHEERPSNLLSFGLFEVLQKTWGNKSQPVSRNYRVDKRSCLSIHLRLRVLKLSCLRLYIPIITENRVLVSRN